MPLPQRSDGSTVDAPHTGVVRKWLAIAALLLAAACQTTTPPLPTPYSYEEAVRLVGKTPVAPCRQFDFNRTRTVEDHIVRIDNDGQLIPQALPAGLLAKATVEPISGPAAAAMFDHLFCEAEALARQRHAGGAAPTTVRLLVFVHGGLNSFESSDRRVVEKGVALDIICDEVKAAQGCQTGGADWHYPVFVSWPSAALPTLTEQTFRVREGRKVRPLLGALTSPFIIASDVLRGIGDLPGTVYYQLTNEKDRGAWRAKPDWLSHAWETSEKHFCPAEGTGPDGAPCVPGELLTRVALHGLEANLSDYRAGARSFALRGALQTVTLPARYTVGTLYHSYLATSAWDNMKRRTRNIFNPPRDFDRRTPQGIAGRAFFEALFERARSNQSTLRYQVTLVGHSMGAIVINNALDYFQPQWIQTDVLRNIVYMAGAATIAESLNSLAPVLALHNTPVDYYNLALNRVAEVSEMHAAGIVPLGSLLVSIDQHYEDPEHPLRRTIGSEVNTLSALQVIADRLRDAKGRRVFKSFDRCEGTALPSKHGDFSDLPFWRRTTWEPPEPGISTCSGTFLPRELTVHDRMTR